MNELSIAVFGNTLIATLEGIPPAPAQSASRTRRARRRPRSCLLPHVTRLLTLLSPTVEALAIECAHSRTSIVLISFLFGLHHPRLRALAVRWYYPFPRLPHNPTPHQPPP